MNLLSAYLYQSHVPNILTIFLLLLSLLSAQDVVFPDEDLVCPLRCLPITSCSSVLSNHRVQKPVSCGYKGSMPLVCCPADHTECGKISSRTVPPRDIIVSTVPASTTRTPGKTQLSASRRTRGVGGHPASALTLYSWLALVGERDAQGNIDWLCVGSLISQQWLITALHCFQYRSPNVVRFGEHDYNDPHDGALHHDHEIAEVVLHPYYVFPHKYHDLALIKLASQLPPKADVMPLCLPWGDEMTKNITGSILTLTGWGATMFGGSHSSLLHEVNMTVFPVTVCDRPYADLPDYLTFYPDGINDTFLCMGHPDGGKSACQGDSGGPLMYQGEDGRYLLAGIISRGYGCGLRKYPGVHTNLRLASILAWIKQISSQE